MEKDPEKVLREALKKAQRDTLDPFLRGLLQPPTLIDITGANTRNITSKHVKLCALAAIAVVVWGVLAEWSSWRTVFATIVAVVVVGLSFSVVSTAAAVFRYILEKDGFLRAVLPIIGALAVVPVSAVAYKQLAQVSELIAPAALAVTFVSFSLYRFGSHLRHIPLRHIPQRAMVVLCSIVFLPGCLYLVLSSGIDDPSRNFSLGLLGLIVGYWLRVASALIVILVVLPCLYIVIQPDFSEPVRSIAFTFLGTVVAAVLFHR
jgi:hypothetical protein